MVNGLDLFKSYFSGFETAYVLIGGTACDQQFEERGLEFRVTKDLDIILIAEALTNEFTERFWQFVKDGGYENREKNEDEKQYYRFSKPKRPEFPSMLELFSRKPDVITMKEGMTLTPIPADDDLSSLSAILMDEEYYTFTLQHSVLINGLNVASDKALICLKAKAYLDLTHRKGEGDDIDSKKILKHRADVIRLTVVIDKNTQITLPQGMREDLAKFLVQVEKENPSTKDILKPFRLPETPLREVFDILRQVFTVQ